MVKRGTGVAHAETGRLPACRRLYMSYIVVLTPLLPDKTCLHQSG